MIVSLEGQPKQNSEVLIGLNFRIAAMFIIAHFEHTLPKSSADQAGMISVLVA
ncbi:hypothetical protein RB2083_2544 [Rhodobacteraceae bacterium HTCC2083]|nr:hypothetical protein RB2083_2544 [Rhodobacteraceae bacterium HTCC2083]